MSTLFTYGSQPTVQFSSPSIVIHTTDSQDTHGQLRTEDTPLLSHITPTISGGALIQRTLLCDSILGYQIQMRPSQMDRSQIYQITARTIDHQQTLPLSQLVNCVKMAVTTMVSNQPDGQWDAELLSGGFWHRRISQLYRRAYHQYLHESQQPGADPSMRTDEIHLTVQVSIDPYELELTLATYPFSGMGTCQVRVCRGTRPQSFLRDFQLSNDPNQLGRLITPPISDVILLDPTTQRLSEGLLSSLFATQLSSQHSGKPIIERRYSDYHLICKPPSQDPKCPLADAIWQVCQRDGIQVSFAGPSLKDAMEGRWSSAFIANSAYRILPIDTMYLTDRKNTKIELAPCPLVRHLMNEVKGLL